MMTCRTACLVAMVCALAPTGASALETGQIAINGEVSELADLANAIAAAAAGDRIELGSGTFGPVDIDREVTITGIDTGEGLPTIDGGTARTAITISADGVTLESLHVTTSRAEPHQFGIFQSYSEEGCIVVRGGGATIRDSFLDGCHFGVYVLDATAVTIADNSIEKNSFGGIFIRNSQHVEVTSNSLHSNGWGGIDVGTIVFPPGSAAAFRNLARDVVLSEDARAAEEVLAEYIDIRDNSVIGHKLGGIGIGYARNVAVVNNVVTDNGGVAMPQSFPPVSKSTSPGVEGYGIALNCAGYENLVEANTVTNNINIGILLDIVHDTRVAANEVTGSEHGIQLLGSYSNAIERNHVFGNSGTGIRIERGADTNPPSVANLVVGNDLVDNGENGFDTSGRDTAPPGANARVDGLPDDLTQANRWDDGTVGNRHGDFDEATDGFVDADGDGISEVAHPIPGGLAVDRFPLSEARVGALVTEARSAGSANPVANTAGVGLACPDPACDGAGPGECAGG